MTEVPGLFRQEALDFHTGQHRPENLLRIDPPWSRWLYWLTLVLVVAAVIVVATARTSETTSGPALVDAQGRTFVAVVPNASAPDLRRGQLVRLSVPGLEGGSLVARTDRTEVADQRRIRQAGFDSWNRPGVLVTGAVEPHADLDSLPSSPSRGRAVVILRSRTVLGLFLPQVQVSGVSGGGS
jgi:hypothetical protein